MRNGSQPIGAGHYHRDRSQRQNDVRPERHINVILMTSADASRESVTFGLEQPGEHDERQKKRQVGNQPDRRTAPMTASRFIFRKQRRDSVARVHIASPSTELHVIARSYRTTRAGPCQSARLRITACCKL